MRIDRLRYQKKRRSDALSRASLDDMDGGERRLGTASGDDVAWLALACTAQGAASVSKIGACARTLNCPASPARIDLEIPSAERVSRGKLHMAAAPPLRRPPRFLATGREGWLRLSCEKTPTRIETLTANPSSSARRSCMQPASRVTLDSALGPHSPQCWSLRAISLPHHNRYPRHCTLEASCSRVPQ